MGIRSVLLCMLIRRSGNERQGFYIHFTVLTTPGYALTHSALLAWEKPYWIWSVMQCQVIFPLPSQETESFVPYWWTRSGRLTVGSLPWIEELTSTNCCHWVMGLLYFEVTKQIDFRNYFTLTLIGLWCQMINILMHRHVRISLIFLRRMR